MGAEGYDTAGSNPEITAAQRRLKQISEAATVPLDQGPPRPAPLSAAELAELQVERVADAEEWAREHFAGSVVEVEQRRCGTCLEVHAMVVARRGGDEYCVCTRWIHLTEGDVPAP